jgi:hypothetical protein
MKRPQRLRTIRVPKAEYIYGNNLPLPVRREEKPRKKPLVSWFTLERRAHVSPGFEAAA